MFAGPMRSAIRVTRANEARREDFAASVVKEHRQIYEAIEAASPDEARAAVKVHLEGAAQRLLKADRDFWKWRANTWPATGCRFPRWVLRGTFLNFARAAPQNALETLIGFKLIQERACEPCYFGGCFIHGEMAGFENVYLSLRNIAFEGTGARKFE